MLSYRQPVVDQSLRDGAGSLEQRLARGERAAIVETYRLHCDAVRAFARRLVGDAAAAEDLVHDVFVALPEAMRRFDGACSLRSYLVAIAARRSQHHVRGALRRRAMLARFAHQPVAEPLRPDEAVERAELASLLTRALDALPLEQRVAFVLCEVEERTSVEVGRMLDERDGTIRARVTLAKRKLRAELERLTASRIPEVG